MAYPNQLPLDGWRDPTLRALWQQMSPDILSGAIDASDTYTVYGNVFTVVAVETKGVPSPLASGPWPQIAVTDENGIGYSLPAYSAPNA